MSLFCLSVSFSGSLTFCLILFFSVGGHLSPSLLMSLSLFLASLFSFLFLSTSLCPSPACLPNSPVKASLPTGTGVPADVLLGEMLLISNERRWGERHPAERWCSPKPSCEPGHRQGETRHPCHGPTTSTSHLLPTSCLPGSIPPRCQQ